MRPLTESDAEAKSRAEFMVWGAALAQLEAKEKALDAADPARVQQREWIRAFIAERRKDPKWAEAMRFLAG
jgi:hypothetical protein